MGINIIADKGNLSFKSAKYPWCKPGYVPLKVTDRDAQLPLLLYAHRVRVQHREFADDLVEVLKAKGVEVTPRESLMFRAVFEPEEAELDTKDFEKALNEIEQRVPDMQPGELYLWYKHLVHRMYQLLSID